MSIKVHNPLLSSYTDNQRVIEVDGNTIGECLKRLVVRFPKLQLFDEEGEMLPEITICVNGEVVYSEALTRAVKDGDEIHILMLFAGG